MTLWRQNMKNLLIFTKLLQLIPRGTLSLQLFEFFKLLTWKASYTATSCPGAPPSMWPTSWRPWPLSWSIWRRRGHKWSRESGGFHWDNALVHTATSVKNWLAARGMQMVDHTPYSPDLPQLTSSCFPIWRRSWLATTWPRMGSRQPGNPGPSLPATSLPSKPFNDEKRKVRWFLWKFYRLFVVVRWVQNFSNFFLRYLYPFKSYGKF